jgi:hypothetical protein
MSGGWERICLARKRRDHYLAHVWFNARLPDEGSEQPKRRASPRSKVRAGWRGQGCIGSAEGRVQGSGSGLSAVATPGARLKVSLPYYSRAEANKETATQMAHQSPSDTSTIIISAVPRSRAVSRSDWSGRDIPSRALR